MAGRYRRWHRGVRWFPPAGARYCAFERWDALHRLVSVRDNAATMTHLKVFYIQPEVFLPCAHLYLCFDIFSSLTLCPISVCLSIGTEWSEDGRSSCRSLREYGGGSADNDLWVGRHPSAPWQSHTVQPIRPKPKPGHTRSEATDAPKSVFVCLMSCSGVGMAW